MNYYQAMRARKPVTTIPPGIVREDVEASIRQITKALCGRLLNGERLLLVADRADCRDILALMDASDARRETTP